MKKDSKLNHKSNRKNLNKDSNEVLRILAKIISEEFLKNSNCKSVVQCKVGNIKAEEKNIRRK